jgi:hypothetical protein
MPIILGIGIRITSMKPERRGWWSEAGPRQKAQTLPKKSKKKKI